VLAGLTRLIRPLAEIMLIKNMGHHSLPPLKENLVLRFDYKIRVIPPIMTRGYKGRKISTLHFPVSRIQMEQSTRFVPYSLITVHEEAGDECAHGQLTADRFHLQYKDTSLPTSSEMTRTLPRTKSWLSA
jgi:hypothetical protein